jgi:hypothetical protein
VANTFTENLTINNQVSINDLNIQPMDWTAVRNTVTTNLDLANIQLMANIGSSSNNSAPADTVTLSKQVQSIKSAVNSATANELSPEDLNMYLSFVRTNGNLLRSLPAALQNNKAIVLEAVKNNGLALQYSSADLRKDREVVTAAINNAPSSLQYASEDLKKDKALVLKAVEMNGLALYFADDTLKNNLEVAGKAIAQNADALKYAGPNVLADSTIIGPALLERKFVAIRC